MSRLPVAGLIHLLHRVPWGVLATASARMPGFPYATVLPLVPDTRHRPVFLISGLAEHTRNLIEDPRGSVLIFDPSEGDVQTSPRLTLVGETASFEPSSLQISRYLRYRPDAERLLSLGDFQFFRLEPISLRPIEGFGRMGWMAGDLLTEAAHLTDDQERAIVADVSAHLPGGLTLLGVDCFGADLRIDGQRRRIPFADSPVAAEQVAATLINACAGLASR